IGATPFAPPAGARARVVYVNDMSGDIDGLFATVHMLLSPSVDVRAIVGTGTNAAAGRRLKGEDSAEASAALANEMQCLMHRRAPVFVGASTRLAAASTPIA